MLEKNRFLLAVFVFFVKSADEFRKKGGEAQDELFQMVEERFNSGFDVSIDAGIDISRCMGI
ncbi:MAG: hypothetical protein GXP13_05130 [Gammaproteobacteria bacterium]|nr:hypothetical protein [Gammaproteobacteria bacterium]